MKIMIVISRNRIGVSKLVTKHQHFIKAASSPVICYQNIYTKLLVPSSFFSSVSSLFSMNMSVFVTLKDSQGYKNLE